MLDQTVEWGEQKPITAEELAYYEELMKSAPEESPQESEYHKEWLGPLLVERLPSDAWEKWCKDGVLCFGMGGYAISKIYFANPRDGSIYHVVDFDYVKFGCRPVINTVASTLVGSKIYAIGGCGLYSGYLDVHYCDVANQPPLPHGGYEWMTGPKLNNYKCTPFVFSLEGSIYVLSIGVEQSDSPFEVLKPNSDKWDVLSSPPYNLTSRSFLEQTIVGSFVLDVAKKIVIHSTSPIGPILYMYDVKDNEWTQLRLNLEHPIAMSCACYSLHMQDIGLFPAGQGQVFVLDNRSQSFVDSVQSLLLSEGNNSLLEGLPEDWHLFPLRGGRFCLLALFTDYNNRKSYARFGTFDLVQHFASDVSDAKLPKLADESDVSDAKRPMLAGYKVANAEFKCTDITRDVVPLPYRVSNKGGALFFC